MKREEKERLHEDDAFVKFVSATWERIGRRRTLAAAALGLVAAALLGWAAWHGWREHLRNARLSAIDRADTREAMEKVREQYPNDPTLLLRLATAYARRGETGDLTRAESALERARAAAVAPLHKAVIELELAKAKMALEKYEPAFRLLDGLVASTEAAAEIRPLIRNEANWYAGRCLEHLGRAAEARSRYRRVVPDARTDRRDFWQELAAHRLSTLREDALD
jgi:tetratricopeptide (TPR) repeat protein